MSSMSLHQRMLFAACPVGILGVAIIAVFLFGPGSHGHHSPRMSEPIPLNAEDLLV